MPPTPPDHPLSPGMGDLPRSTSLPTRASSEPHHEPDAHSANRPQAPPSGYGPVARRVARRTTDLLAIALVLIAGLGLGRQLIGWWSEPETPAPIMEPATGLRSETPLTLEFGDSAFALERTPVAGSRETALARLVDACAAIAASPTAQLGPPTPPTPAEVRLIAAAAALEPVREDPDRWRIQVVDGPVIMAAALSQSSERSDPTLEPGDSRTNESQSPGVLCWGLAFPADESRWVLYTFRPAAESTSSAVPEIAACLPRGSRQVLSAVDAAGDRFTMFEGPGPLDAWQRSITACLETAGYHESTRSQLTTSGWTARFEPSGTQHLPAIEIYITPSESNTLTGIVTTHQNQ